MRGFAQGMCQNAQSSGGVQYETVLVCGGFLITEFNHGRHGT